MVLIHDNGKIYEANEKRKWSCYRDSCRKRLRVFNEETGQWNELPHVETNLGKICDDCLREITIGGKNG